MICVLCLAWMQHDGDVAAAVTVVNGLAVCPGHLVHGLAPGALDLADLHPNRRGRAVERAVRYAEHGLPLEPTR